MLILTRKEDEAFTIGDNIRILITEIGRGSVKIGIEAPHQTIILREELRNTVKEINIKASKNKIDENFSELSKKIKK